LKNDDLIMTCDLVSYNTYIVYWTLERHTFSNYHKSDISSSLQIPWHRL